MQINRGFHAGEVDRGDVGGLLQSPEPGAGELDRFIGAVANPHHHEGVGEAGDAEADAPLGGGFAGLGFEGKPGDVNRVVEHANGGADGGVKGGGVEGGVVFKRVADEAGQVDGAEQAGAVGRQGLFAAGVGGLDILAVVEVVTLVEALLQKSA